jgi:hypothetical protein
VTFQEFREAGVPVPIRVSVCGWGSTLLDDAQGLILSAGLLHTLRRHPGLYLASQTFASGNQMVGWLRQIDGLRPAM